MAKFQSPQESWAAHRDYPYCIEPGGDWDERAARRLDETMVQVWLLAVTRQRAEDTTVLDVGCNSGHALQRLLRIGIGRVAGVDISPGMVRLCLQKGLDAQVMPAEDIAAHFGPHAFDVVILGEILEHVYDPDYVLRQACNVAKRGVVGSVPSEKSEWNVTAGHRYHTRVFDYGSLEGLLHGLVVNGPAAGYTIREIPSFYVWRVEL